jgi:replicative DNA helicase
MLDKEQISSVMSKINPNHFYYVQYRYIFEAICTLYISGSPLNSETISNFLKGKKELDKNRLEAVGGSSVIIECMENVSNGEADYWMKVVLNKHGERKLLEFSNEVRKAALSSPEDIQGIRHKLEERLISLTEQESAGSVSVADSTEQLIPILDKYINDPDGIRGIVTGYRKFDRAVDGLSPGNVSIYYAPSSRFKSLVVTNIGHNIANNGIPGLWFTTEMPSVQVTERLVQLEYGGNFRHLRLNNKIRDQRDGILEANDRVSRLPIFFNDSSGLDIQDIRLEVSRHKRWNNIQYVIIDLVDHVYSSRYADEAVNNQRVVMAQAKAIAKELDVHIMLVSHISKQMKQNRSNADNDVEEMIGSAAKFQDVDLAVSLSPYIVEDDGRMIAMPKDVLQYKQENLIPIDMLVSINKNRHGPLARIYMTIDLLRGGRLREVDRRME